MGPHITVNACDDILSYAALWLQMYSISWYFNHVLTMKDKELFVYTRGISYTMLLLLLSFYQIPSTMPKMMSYVVE